MSLLDKWTMDPSGDGKWITILGPEYGERIEVHNDDVLEDQTPLAEKIVRLLNEERVGDGAEGGRQDG